jgi:hypothetical protein
MVVSCLIFVPEDGGSMLLRNVDDLPKYIASEVCAVNIT